MKKIVHFTFLLLFALSANAQVVVLDFEGAGTSTDFQYFGSSIENTLTTPIANPDPSGINMSANVIGYVKPGDALSWAGAFSNPNPAVPIDLTNGGQICIDVWMDHIGSLALKIENSTTGGANWITTVANTTTNAWETICFDTSLPSIEDPFTPASGNSYSTLVLFFDFNTAGTGTDVTSYFDNVRIETGGGGVTEGDITFSLNMNDYNGSFTTPYVAGSFNNWAGDANPLADADGDGIWETTITVPVGVHEYKFSVDNLTDEEMFSGLDECTNTTIDGPDVFTNRQIVVSGDATLGTVCFNSCYNCGDGAMITFNLGMNGMMVDTGGVYLAGGGNFDAPGGRFQLSDDDGDGIYSITLERMNGFESYYTFANGNCPDWTCKEDISGQPCADPNNFNDRFLPAISGDITINTCFAVCSNTTDCEIVDGTTEPLATDFRIYPTLVVEQSIIEFSDYSNNKEIYIYNAVGKMVQSISIEAGQATETLDLGDLSNGIYLVTVKSGKQVSSQRIVKASN